MELAALGEETLVDLTFNFIQPRRFSGILSFARVRVSAEDDV